MIAFQDRSNNQQAYAKKLLFLLSIFLLPGCLFSLSTPTPTPTIPPTIVQVIVRDSVTQETLKQAQVSLQISDQIFPSKLTGDDGLAVFEVSNDFMSSVAIFEIQKEGYGPQTQSITIANAKIVPIVLDSLPPTATSTPASDFSTATATSLILQTPSVTSTPKNTATPTVTPTLPNSINCEHPAITRRIFPQLSEIIQFSFIGPKNNENFECLGVYDRVHTSEDLDIAVFFEFEAVENGFAYFGMGIPDGFDVTEFSELCFWAFAEEPNQAFELQLKDSDEKIASQIIFHEIVNVWQEHCVSINEFGSVNLESIIDFSVGFNNGLGNIAIWFDDFELR